MDKAPQFVQLALSEGQWLPQMQHNEPTMLSCAIEPEADGILIHLDDPCRCADRVAFRQGANSQGKEGRIVLQIKIRCSICQATLLRHARHSAWRWPRVVPFFTRRLSRKPTLYNAQAGFGQYKVSQSI